MQISSSNFNPILPSFGPTTSIPNGFPSQNTRIGVGPNTFVNQPIINRQPIMTSNRSFDRFLPHYAPNRSFSPIPSQRTNIPVGMPMSIGMVSPSQYRPIGPMIPMGSVNPIVNPISPIGQVNPQGQQRMLGVSSLPMPYPPQPAYLGYKILKDIPNQYQKQQQQQINVTILDPKVYCVLCERQYQSKDRQQHAKKHRRQQQNGFQIKNLIKQIQAQEQIPQTRPIVQPQQYNIQYNPNQYTLEKIVNYVTPPPTNINNSNLPPVVPQRQNSIISNQNSIQQGLNQSNYQPQSINLPNNQAQPIRLTTQEQTVTYNDPNHYQGGRIQRESQINPQQIVPAIVNDSRFSNNSLIIDEPNRPTLPQSLIYTNRQTIQQNQPNISTNLSGSINSNLGLPQRPTLISQEFRNSQNNQSISNSNSISNPPMYSSLNPSQRIQQNHQSVMSPIREESLRQTASVAGQDQRLSQQQIYPSNNNASQQLAQQTSILDDFAYGNKSPDNNIIPRQSRNSGQNQMNSSISGLRQPSQIPFSQIINEKIG